MNPAAAAWLHTVVLFLAFELSFYVDHYTNHRFDVFWEIHRVHHTAEVLTPLTIFRIHPLEGIKYHAITAILASSAVAFSSRLIPGSGWTVDGTDVLTLVLWMTVNHLQHSNVWIPLFRPLRYIIAGPAHHQMHHSDDPAYARCNLAGLLALLDWIFGTLRVPPTSRPNLRFGVDSGPGDNHSFAGALVLPVVRASRALVPRGLRTGALDASPQPEPEKDAASASNDLPVASITDNAPSAEASIIVAAAA